MTTANPIQPYIGSPYKRDKAAAAAARELGRGNGNRMYLSMCIIDKLPFHDGKPLFSFSPFPSLLFSPPLLFSSSSFFFLSHLECPIKALDKTDVSQSSHNSRAIAPTDIYILDEISKKSVVDRMLQCSYKNRRITGHSSRL